MRIALHLGLTGGCRGGEEIGESWYAVAMRLTIELERETDGRWIAEVPELNILVYGESRLDAIQLAQIAAREIVLDRIAHAELPPDSANATFDIAA